jgi:hypothetical protein
MWVNGKEEVLESG